jgi:hypothetical protein
MRPAPVLIILVLLQVFLCLSCNEPFSPKGPFQEQLVVYSVLSNDRDLQYVRVYSSYDVPAYDPFANKADNAITGAQVVISSGKETHVFRDTLLPRSDTSRYKTPIHAYVSNWRAQQGQVYDLRVNAGGKTSDGVAVGLPSKPVKLELINAYILDDSSDSKAPGAVYFSAQVNQLAKGFACKMWIEYLVSTAAGWKSERIEVMSDILTLIPVISRNQNNSVWFYRSKAAYEYTLHRVLDGHPGQKITFKKVVFKLLQLEHNMYDYYNIVHGFQDPFTIRFDEPDYTNLSNGFGLFGAYSLDSLVHPYQDEFGYNRK